MEELHGTDSMGETAENVAQRYDVSREDQDAFALESHRRAVAAAEAGFFDDELVTVEAPQPKGDPMTVHADEGPRPDSSLERLAKLRAIFREGGSVTAGNSSPINDGAACLVVASEERARGAGRRAAGPDRGHRRRRRGALVHGRRARSPPPGWRCERAGPDDRRHRPGRAQRGLRLPGRWPASASWASTSTKLNVNGGAIAIGHPLGASGARLIGTLARELRRRGARYGVATMCIGVGQGLATVIENPAA